MLDSSFYVDDLIYGSNLDEDTYYLSSTASEILKEAGMKLRKFQTNSGKLQSMWKVSNLCTKEEKSNNFLQVLGLIWNTDSNVLMLDIKSFEESFIVNPTKRSILKMLLKLFDPLGFLGPFIVRINALLKETWQRGLEWNSELPPELKQEW